MLKGQEGEYAKGAEGVGYAKGTEGVGYAKGTGR